MTLVWACYKFKQLAGKNFKYHVCYVQLKLQLMIYLINSPCKFYRVWSCFLDHLNVVSDPFAPFLKLITYYTLNISFLCVFKAFAVHTCTSHFYCSSLLFGFFAVFRNKLTAQSELLTSWYTCTCLWIFYKLFMFVWVARIKT